VLINQFEKRLDDDDVEKCKGCWVNKCKYLKVCWTKAKYNPTLDVHMGKHPTLKEKNA
jgi:hypothetical protein